MQQQKYIMDDNTAGAILYQRYAAGIFAYLLRQTASREDAEDLLLEVFLAALQRSNVLALSEQEQRAWLWTVARNKAIDFHRRNLRHPNVQLKTAEETIYANEEQAPEQYVLKQEEYAQLHIHMRELSDLQQEVLRLRFGHDLSCAEIAVVMEKSEGAVRMLLSRTLKLLRVIYSYNAQSGKLNWKHTVDDWASSPTVVNGVVYAGSYDTNLYALKASNGSELWHYTTGGHIFASPLVSNGVVYVTEDSNASEISDHPPTVKPALFAINAAKGTKLWSQPLNISVQAIQDGVIYGSVFPRAVYALKASDGSVIWQQQYGPDLIDKMGFHSGATSLVAVVP
jgi:RNA polymerase sigma-70 factor (ECF subfamily)